MQMSLSPSFICLWTFWVVSILDIIINASIDMGVYLLRILALCFVLGMELTVGKCCLTELYPRPGLWSYPTLHPVNLSGGLTHLFAYVQQSLSIWCKSQLVLAYDPLNMLFLSLVCKDFVEDFAVPKSSWNALHLDCLSGLISSFLQ